MRRLLFLTFFIASISASAQSGDTTFIKSVLAKQLGFDTLYVRTISFTGNFKTKPELIRREIPLQEGDTIAISNLDNRLVLTRQFLINLFLFNSVTVTVSDNIGPYIDIKIDMQERWYVWPIPIFELADRNFNQWWLTKDLNRTNYGFFMSAYNIRGSNETMKLALVQGYTHRYELDYKFPYINKNKSLGLNFNIKRTSNKEVWYDTRNSKLQFYSDSTNFNIKRFSTTIGFNLKPKYRITNRIDVGYNSIKIGDTVLSEILNPQFTNNNTHQQGIELKYTHIRDFRDFKGYPLSGFYFKNELRDLGLELLKGKHIISLTSQFSKYFKLNNDYYASFQVKGKVSNRDDQPYNELQALGYKDLVRGYELYVVDGQHYGLFKGAVKKAILPQKEFLVNKIPVKQYKIFPVAAYVNMFYDMGYVSSTYNQNNNFLNNSLLLGYGAGIDLVFYYDRVFRFEYTINKQAASGLYVHFTYPI